MFETQPENTEVKPLYTEILNLYDEFADFSEQCAFLCDAYVSLALYTESMDRKTVNGMERSTRWLKYRVEEIKERLRIIHQRSVKEFKRSAK